MTLQLPRVYGKKRGKGPEAGFYSVTWGSFLERRLKLRLSLQDGGSGVKSGRSGKGGGRGRSLKEPCQKPIGLLSFLHSYNTTGHFSDLVV